MLTPAARRVADLLVFADDARPARSYAVLARPRIASDSQGASRLRLVLWRPAAAADASISGGRLSMDLEIAPSPAEIAAAGLAGQDVLPLPWRDAAVVLHGPGFEPVRAELSLADGAHAAIAVDLAPPAAALLAPMLEGDASLPLQVEWSGLVTARLPAVEVDASVDADAVRAALASSSGSDRVEVTRAVLRAQARIEIGGGADAALTELVTDAVLAQFERRLDAGLSSLSVHMAASDVVDWPLQLSTTLEAALPAQARRGLVERVLLDDAETGRPPTLAVRVLGAFGNALERVDLQLAPADSDEAIELSAADDRVQTLTLAGRRAERWRRRVKLFGQPVGDWSAWTARVESSALLVPVQVDAPRSIEVLAAGLDFATRWAVAEVRLTSQTPAADSGPLRLDREHGSLVWALPPGVSPPTLRAEAVFVSRQGARCTAALAMTGEQCIVRDPFDGHRLRRSILPVGNGWNEVAQAMLDLRYDDGTQRVDETLELRRLDDFLQWEVPARPDGPQAVQWRLHLSRLDGRFASGEWLSGEGSVIVVRVDGTARREVLVLPLSFDAARARRALLRCVSGAEPTTIEIADRTPRRTMLPAGPYRWTLQWTLTDGSETAPTPEAEGSDVLVLPAMG